MKTNYKFSFLKSVLRFKDVCLRTSIAILLMTVFSCQEDTIEPEFFGNVFGEVLMTDDNTPVDMATISTNPPTSSVFSDIDGRFVLESIPEGTYSLRAEKNGFLTQVTTVAVFGNQDASVIIRLPLDSLDNYPPSVPVSISPIDEAQDQSINTVLQWSASDIDEDVLRFDVILFNDDQTQSIEVASAITDSTFTLEGLEYASNYFWQVIVDDGKNDPVFSPVWSFRTEDFPDHRFVFAKSENGKYDIFSSDLFGNSIQLTDNNASNWRPRMNPGRTKIAYLSNANIEPQIYIMDRDGSNPTMITEIPVSSTGNQFELDFSWSPDGTKLLYTANSKLYSINDDGSGINLLAQAPFGFSFAECDWNGPAELISVRTVGVNVYNSSIYTLEEDGTYISQVFPDISGNTGGPAFSIDGSHILYSHDISGFEANDGRQLDAHIFTRNISNNIITDISAEKPDGTNDLDPRFSPDGSKIIFMNTNNDGISPKSIWIMDTDGTDRELLFENAEMPEWK